MEKSRIGLVGESEKKMLRLVLSACIAALLIIYIPFLCFSEQGGGEQDSKEKVIQSLEKTGMPGTVISIIVSMIPIFELRGGIPIAINVFKMKWWVAFIACVAGNMVPVVPILLFLDGVSKALSKFVPFRKFFNWLFERTKRKGGVIERYEFWGLAIFVGIPLPMTGAWTGAIAAFLFGMNLGRAVLSIFIGVLIAGIIVTTLSILGVIGAIVAGVALAAMIVWTVTAGRKKEIA